MKRLILLTLACALFGGGALWAEPVNVAVTRQMSPLNPVAPDDAAAVAATGLLFSPLVALKDDLTYQPLLAEKVEQTSPREVTVTLRPARWTDGRPVTADDVIFTVNLITNREMVSGLTADYRCLEGTDDEGFRLGESLSGVRKLDDRRVVFRGKKPLPLDLFNDQIGRYLQTVPSHVWSAWSPKDCGAAFAAADSMVTDGPMILTDFDPASHVSFRPNWDYVLGAPKIDGLNLKVMDPSTLAVALANGEVDMNVPQFGMVPASDVERVRALKNLETFLTGPNSVQLLFMNNERLASPALRRALSEAIDRQALVDGLLSGRGEPAWSFFTSLSPYRDPRLVPVFDPAQARVALEQASFDFDRPLRFVVPSGKGTAAQVAQILQAGWAALGVKVEILSFDFPTVMSKAVKGDFDLLLMSTSLSHNNPTMGLQFFVCKGNYNRYHNPELDSLVETMLSVTDREELKKDAFAMQALLWRDCPMVSLFAPRDLLAVSKRMVRGRPKNFDTFSDVEQWEKR